MGLLRQCVPSDEHDQGKAISTCYNRELTSTQMLVAFAGVEALYTKGSQFKATRSPGYKS